MRSCVAAAGPMGDRNVQEWISDQLYTLLGEAGSSLLLLEVHLWCMFDLGTV